MFRGVVHGQFERVLDRDVGVIPTVGSRVFLAYNKEEPDKNGHIHKVTKMVDGIVNSARYVYGPTAEDDCVIVSIDRSYIIN